MSEQQNTEVAAYAQAAQNCRDIATEVGVPNCDDSPDWRAAERDANTAYDTAIAAGHSVDEVLKAGRAK
jgi:hypothetical protein